MLCPTPDGFLCENVQTVAGGMCCIVVILSGKTIEDVSLHSPHQSTLPIFMYIQIPVNERGAHSSQEGHEEGLLEYEYTATR